MPLAAWLPSYACTRTSILARNERKSLYGVYFIVASSFSLESFSLPLLTCEAWGASRMKNESLPMAPRFLIRPFLHEAVQACFDFFYTAFDSLFYKMMIYGSFPRSVMCFATDVYDCF